MKKLALLVILLSGCSANHSIVPAAADRPAIVTVSAYTHQGCLEKLRLEAAKRNWEIKEIPYKADAAGITGEILLFPFFKGVSCSAYILTGTIPKEF
ncbi:hypothetical protein GMST_35180 [Geomonas silvestris]|uniref:Lipoprotein n=1 Tax=Geomonas silvestris TaxID=2740184 RepID=A0A6V8MNA6_9BACT|nr:hypothetical protein [Geomonas silvestris]GFO61193.1 hypothetical protein GMST_35180 [Geomonas silvestris]